MNITLEDAIKLENLDNLVYKRRSNGLLLNDYQINILLKNDINYLKYSNYNELLFDIEESLKELFDDELDRVGVVISEFAYYGETKK